MVDRGRPDKQSSDAWFISDRSGMRFRMKDGIKEPGTGYFIAKHESDGMWNAVDHPQANLQKWATLSGDPYPVENSRPDRQWAMDYSLDGNDGTDLVDDEGTTIDLGKEDPLV